jgi:hypothetical protein
MASSPADAATPSPRAFALQELIACWNQGYEALLRGDVDAARSLLDLADDHIAAAGDGHGDSAAEAALRISAASSRGRLEHAMKAGLAGLQQELTRARQGGKALRGYGSSVAEPNVVRDA